MVPIICPVLIPPTREIYYIKLYRNSFYYHDVKSIDNDDHTILYEDGDEEMMDTEQVEYA